MEYTKDTMQDGTTYERYEGTPEEIANLLYLQENGMYTLENDDNLGTIGYSFVAGLNSYGISDDNKNKEED